MDWHKLIINLLTRCNATNPLLFSLSGPPVDIRLAAVDQHTLRVSWKPPLTEHWNGDILGKQKHNS